MSRGMGNRYFTSRPKLKQLSQNSHGVLSAAEQLFALRTPAQVGDTRYLHLMISSE
jgi:hypothetical protein